MPRRYYQYLPQFQNLNVASTLGATLLLFGFLLVAANLGLALRYGRAPGSWSQPSASSK